MKKIILASVLAFGFAYAADAQTELEHATKSAPSEEAVSGDMSAMKAAGKCGADQKAMDKTKMKAKKAEMKKGKAEAELEHAIKTQTSEEAPKQDMSKMKAAGKCNSGQ